MFRLRKWYLDCVTPKGDVFIGYSARLRWDPGCLRYASTLLCPPVGKPTERQTLLPTGGPLASPRGLRWRSRALRLAAAWHRRSVPIERTLLDGDGARIEWACVAPLARARIRLGDRTLTGLGYVERLTLLVEPWRLPFDTLHWGRFLAPGTSLVWIAWEGDGAASYLFRDSRPTRLVRLTPGRVESNDGAVLELGAPRVLRGAPVMNPLLRVAPPLAMRTPAGFLAAREEKWLSQGRLAMPGLSPVSGWAVYETVRLR